MKPIVSEWLCCRQTGAPVTYCSLRIFHMNVSQMHERLRVELLRRIQRGSLSVSLLARQTGFGQSHLSNFLRRKRQLSLTAIDRVLASQNLTAADLLPTRAGGLWLENSDSGRVPLVSHATAMFEPLLRPAAVQKLVPLPPGLLERQRSRASASRRRWVRFVAVVVSPDDAAPMAPLLLPGAIIVLDRHYNSLAQYRPSAPNLCGVRDDGHLKLRYVDFQSNRLVLRPHVRTASVDLLEVPPGESPGDLIIGRVVLVINEI